jgi:hypothetical protein
MVTHKPRSGCFGGFNARLSGHQPDTGPDPSCSPSIEATTLKAVISVVLA